MHQPQPLIWLARSAISSCVDFGSGDCAITRLALANRLLNLAPISLSNMLNRDSMMWSSLVVLRLACCVLPCCVLPDRTNTRCRRSGPCDCAAYVTCATTLSVSQDGVARCLVGNAVESE